MPETSTTEGGRGGGVLRDDNASNCSDAAESVAEACIQLASGNLQRTVSVNIKTIPTVPPSGKLEHFVASTSK